MLQAKLIRRYIQFNPNIITFDQINSTQTYLLNSRLSIPTLVVSTKQTQGYGTHGRQYYGNGGVYFSLYLPYTSINNDKLTILTSIIVTQVLEKYLNKDLKIKWLNDIYLENKKVVGILANAIRDNQNKVTGHIIGIGINLFKPENDFPKELLDKAGYLFAKKNIAIEEIVGIIVNRIYFEYQSKFINLDYYNEKLLFNNQEILVKYALNPTLVKVLGIDSDAKLIINDHNKIKSFSREEIEIIKY